MTKEREALDMIAKLQMVEQTMEAACKRIDELKAENKSLKEALAQPEQEPVAWIRRHPNGALSNEVLIHVQVETARRESGAWVPLYTTPPQRTWVGLTDEEMFKTWLTVPAETEDRLAFGRAIEAKLKEKNT